MRLASAEASCSAAHGGACSHARVVAWYSGDEKWDGGHAVEFVRLDRKLEAGSIANG